MFLHKHMAEQKKVFLYKCIISFTKLKEKNIGRVSSTSFFTASSKTHQYISICVQTIAVDGCLPLSEMEPLYSVPFS